MTHSQALVLQHIGELVAADIGRLPASVRTWTEAHLATPPRMTVLATDRDGSGTVSLWLVTEHTGVEDSSSRVVFDPAGDKFGLAMDLEGGVTWFMGFYAGTFADVILAM